MSARKLAERDTSTLAVHPVTVTDRTCAAVVGLEPRAFREAVARLKIPHAMLGRRMVVRVADFLAALDRVAAASADKLPAPRVETLETAEGVLAELGLSRKSA